jgi:hypothetical protein
VRIDGRPRLRHVASLGSIELAQIEQPFARLLFWRQARSVLDLLVRRRRIRSGDRVKAIALMCGKAGSPPTPKEEAVIAAGILQALQELRNAIRRPSR